MPESSHACFRPLLSYTLFSSSLLQLLCALFPLCYLQVSSPPLHHALPFLALLDARPPLIRRVGAPFSTSLAAHNRCGSDCVVGLPVIFMYQSISSLNSVLPCCSLSLTRYCR
jgi:hypothetical protein